jgi:two-component system, NarL family, sensor histidine kinase UhpB
MTQTTFFLVEEQPLDLPPRAEAGEPVQTGDCPAGTDGAILEELAAPGYARMNTDRQPLRVLIVEDSDNDAALLKIKLEDAGYEPFCHRVETRAGMSAALERQQWDLVVADYRMPHFDGLSALALVKEKGLDLPFVIVSGRITDETAVGAMRAGAHDYVMKDNLARLGPAVARELREAGVRQARRQTEETLKVEHSFREAIENSVPSGITAIDLEGRMTYVNPAFCEMVGWSELELLGAKPPFAYWPAEEEGKIAGAFAKILQGTAPPSGLEMQFRRRSGERFHVLLQVTPLKNSFGDVTGWVSSASDITELRRAEEALRRAHDELEMRVQHRTAELKTANAKLQAAISERKRLEHELLEITEKERRRIALDLHDDLGQKLSGIAFMTKALEGRLAKQPSEAAREVAREAAKIHTLVQETMNHASDLAHDLATLDFKEIDLPAALAMLASRAEELFHINCRFKPDGVIPSLDPNIVTQLYKISQESVTNAFKHGKAKRVSLGLTQRSEHLVLTVRNDGLPFPDLKGKGTGMGLRIMSYRASLINASLDVKAAGAHGTLVTCSVPLEPRK